MERESSFEELIQGLESVVRDLEAGNLPLDRSLERYHKGIDLLKACYRTLDAMEKRIEILEGEGAAPAPFVPEEEREEGG